MGEHPNEALVRRAYAALSAGDLKTLGEMWAPDVVHAIPGNNPLSGEHKGQSDVFSTYGMLFERSAGSMRAELLDVTAAPPSRHGPELRPWPLGCVRRHDEAMTKR